MQVQVLVDGVERVSGGSLGPGATWVPLVPAWHEVVVVSVTTQATLSTLYIEVTEHDTTVVNLWPLRRRGLIPGSVGGTVSEGSRQQCLMTCTARLYERT
jgi:hypothetical protein